MRSTAELKLLESWRTVTRVGGTAEIVTESISSQIMCIENLRGKITVGIERHPIVNRAKIYRS